MKHPNAACSAQVCYCGRGTCRYCGVRWPLTQTSCIALMSRRLQDSAEVQLSTHLNTKPLKAARGVSLDNGASAPEPVQQVWAGTHALNMKKCCYLSDRMGGG